MFNVPYNTHTSILYKKLNIPKLHDIDHIQLGNVCMITQSIAYLPRYSLYLHQTEIYIPITPEIATTHIQYQ